MPFEVLSGVRSRPLRRWRNAAALVLFLGLVWFAALRTPETSDALRARTLRTSNENQLPIRPGAESGGESRTPSAKPDSADLDLQPLAAVKPKSDTSAFLLSAFMSFKRRHGSGYLQNTADQAQTPAALRNVFVARAKEIEKAMDRNQHFVVELVKAMDRSDGTDTVRLIAEDSNGCPGMFDSLERLLAHIGRDWTEEYLYTAKPVHDAIFKLLDGENIVSGRTLVPGSGLGRLAYELAKRGFPVDAVECSPASIAAGHALLGFPRSLDLHPFLHLRSNLEHGDARDQLVKLAAPLPLHQNSDKINLTFIKSDFASFKYREEYDLVVSSFFTDKASLDTISGVLGLARTVRPGGYFLHAGPLDWPHGSGPELSLDDVVLLLNSHPECRMEVVARTEVTAPYARREGVSFSGERYRVPVLLFRKGV